VTAVASPLLLVHQGRTLAALGRAALSSVAPRRAASPSPARALPGEWVEDRAPAPPPALVSAFVRGAGGEPAHYRGILPPHLYPQWTFPIASRLFARAPYPLVRVLNAGTTMVQRAPLPAGEPLVLRARLEAVEDDGARARLTVRVVTSTRSSPDALTSLLSAYVPLAAAPRGKPKRPRPTVPLDAHELAFRRFSRTAGREFAWITGDVNPIHWSPAYARVAGFGTCILHGFATFATSVEAVVRARLSGDVARLAQISARFVRPLPLPRSVGVYLTPGGRLLLGDAPGGDVYLDGELTLA
jgi:hypothetical protein